MAYGYNANERFDAPDGSVANDRASAVPDADADPASERGPVPAISEPATAARDPLDAAALGWLAPAPDAAASAAQERPLDRNIGSAEAIAAMLAQQAAANREDAHLQAMVGSPPESNQVDAAPLRDELPQWGVASGPSVMVEPYYRPQAVTPPPVTPPPVAPPPVAARSGRETSAAGQGIAFLATVAILLATARFLLPSVVEEVRYAWHRGELRAEYETSGEGLRNVGLDSLSHAYQMVTQRVGPSVVHIDVQRTLSEGEAEVAEFLQQRMELPEISDQGSGVVVDEAGYILTNEHVIIGGNSIRVGLSDGRTLPATLVGTDSLTDLAVLKIDADGLMPIQWGDSDRAKVGSPVWAVGSPFGLDRTVTFGILSGKHRVVKASTRYQDFMQSDVAVNPGNSGGPLVDSRGELIGINTAIVGDTYRGVSFSIPSKVARRVYEHVRQTGSVERGWLGVALQEVSDELHQGPDPRVRGALVTGLADAGSPAAQAGILPGDVIIAIDGVDLLDMGQLMRVVGDLTIGDQVQMRVLRDGTTQELNVKIGARPDALTGR